MNRQQKRSIRAIVLLVVIGIGSLFLAGYATSPIDPKAWEPPDAPEMTGVLAPNDALARAELLALPEDAHGPEDVALSAAGVVYTGTEDGRLLRMTDVDDSPVIETIVDSGGRPLGLKLDSRDNLFVCDARHGLLRVNPDGTVDVLAVIAGDVNLGFPDDLDVASDGRVYFSDATLRFPTSGTNIDLMEASTLDALEQRPSGRLIRYDPETNRSEVLLDDLAFANGVAIDPAGQFVLVAETSRYKIRRYWIAGEKAGRSDVFAENLPGFPDGISTSPRGTYWVALVTPRLPEVDRLQPHPVLKRVVARVPEALKPKPVKYGLVVELDAGGKILRSLHDPRGEQVSHVTNAVEHGNRLYLGTLHGDAIARYPLEDLVTMEAAAEDAPTHAEDLAGDGTREAKSAEGTGTGEP